MMGESRIANQTLEDLPNESIRQGTLEICDEISIAIKDYILSGLRDWAFRARQGEHMST